MSEDTQNEETSSDQERKDNLPEEIGFGVIFFKELDPDIPFVALDVTPTAENTFLAASIANIDTDKERIISPGGESFKGIEKINGKWDITRVKAAYARAFGGKLPQFMSGDRPLCKATTAENNNQTRR